MSPLQCNVIEEIEYHSFKDKDFVPINIGNWCRRLFTEWKDFNKSLPLHKDGSVFIRWYGAAGYSHAATPFVRSQEINGTTQKLFRIHTLGHGNAVNDDFKISISNIKAAGSVTGDDYGSFTLQVRKGDDTDTRPISLETYANLSLDPANPNYIARRIGSQYRSYDSNGKLIVNGFYPNISKYIRVEIDEAVEILNKVCKNFK